MDYGFRKRMQQPLSEQLNPGVSKDIAALLEAAGQELQSEGLRQMPSFITRRGEIVHIYGIDGHGIELHLRLIGLASQSSEEQAYLVGTIIDLTRKPDCAHQILEGALPYDPHRIALLLRPGLQYYRESVLNPRA